VDAQALLEGGEELGEALPGPGQAGLEDRLAHALDAGKHAHQEIAVRGPVGRQGEAAVATDDGGDAVPDAAGGQRLEGELGVVVGVDVDNAGGDHEAVRVDG